MITENTAELLSLAFGSFAEPAAAYYCFSRLISHRALLWEYAAVILLGVIFPSEPIAFTVIMTAAGMLFAGGNILKNAAAAVADETVFQLSFSLFGSLVQLLAGAINAEKIQWFGITAMVVSELLSLLTAVLILQRLSEIFSAHRLGRNALTMLLPLPAIFIFGNHINHNILGNTVSYDNMISVGHSLYTAAALAAGMLGICALFISAGRLSGLEYANRMQEKYITAARETLDKTKAYRHDCKAHMTVLRELVHSGETTTAQQYFSELEKSYALPQDCRTGNIAADIIISDKLRTAAEKNIRTECALRLPEENINDTDICTLLSNALDNAINGCDTASGDKYIKIQSVRQGNLLLIELENSFDGNRDFVVGTGIGNMRKTAKKYGGSVYISCEGNLFRTSIALNIPQHKTDISRKSY